MIRRGRKRSDCYRAAVPFLDGPDAAAHAAVDKINHLKGFGWSVLGAALSMNGGDLYAYPIGPASMAPAVKAAVDSATAPRRPESHHHLSCSPLFSLPRNRIRSNVELTLEAQRRTLASQVVACLDV